MTSAASKPISKHFSDDQSNKIKEIEKLELIYSHELDLNVVVPNKIKSVEHGKKLRKFILMKRNGVVKTLKIKWRGWINGHLCVGVELKDEIPIGTDGTFCSERLFECTNGRSVLIPSYELRMTCESDPTGHIENMIPNDIRIGDVSRQIKHVHHDRICCAKWSDKIKTHPELRIGSRIKYNSLDGDIRGTCEWIGKLNGVEAVGIRMDADYGGWNGKFDDLDLFTCPKGKGFLLLATDIVHGPPYESINIPQEHRLFNEININFPVKIYYLNDEGKINSAYETLRWSGIDENNEYFFGIELDGDINIGTDGTFKGQKLFICQNGLGILAPINCVCKISRDQRSFFNVDQIINTKEIRRAKKSLRLDVCEIHIGDPAIVKVNDKQFVGELKWIGSINTEICVGVDMEDEFEYGMDGLIFKNVNFYCLPKHGLVTLLSNIKQYEMKVELLDNGFVNPHKYLKCEKKENEKMNEKELKINDLVWVRIKGENGKLTPLKGTLRWCGLMNGVSVGAIELDKGHKTGTDGTFWRQKLFQCSDKKAIAIQWENIVKYYLFMSKIIPKEHRKIPDLDINSLVQCNSEGVIGLGGTIRWSGVDENDEYLYGIELDDVRNGTDGTFKSKKLFTCVKGHGLLVPINRVDKDNRFIEPDPLKGLRMSDESTVQCLALLVKLSQGKYKGIQGDTWFSFISAFFSALFGYSDVLDFLISPIIDDCENILRWKIIYPLREFGFVSGHRTKELKDVVSQYGTKFDKMMRGETDIGTIPKLLSKLCSKEQLLRFVSPVNCNSKSMSLPLIFTLQKKPKFLTIETMVYVSMIQNKIMFAEFPTCLIVQPPQDENGKNSYEYTLPKNIIEISQICSDCWRKCSECEREVTFQCTRCLEENNFAIQFAFRCEDHSCQHKERVKTIKSVIKSKSKVFMELKAIICQENNHFASCMKHTTVSEKKSKGKHHSPHHWIFFDSTDSNESSNKYGVPFVTLSKEVTNFLNCTNSDMEKRIQSCNTGDLKRIVKDCCVFVYHNTAKTCY